MIKGNNERIKEYYKVSTFFYRYLWGNKKNLAMHFGFWDDKTKNLNDALINENRFVSEILNAHERDQILDAGCGVGGSAIWIAENTQASVTGITIVDSHINLANKNASERGVENLTKFELRDFCATGLPSGLFDSIYSIESVCHAETKRDFLKEASRLLKKGGKLVICDGFLIKENMDEKDRKYYKALCTGWALPNLAYLNEFKKDIAETGFTNIEFIDAKDKIKKSSDEMYKSSKYIHILVAVLVKLRLTSKINLLAEEACEAQYHIFNDQIATYGVFKAEKL